MASGKIEYFYPHLTTNGITPEQAFLNQLLVPKLSNKNHKIANFFKKKSEALTVEKSRSQKAFNKIIPLNAEYECDFESYLRNSKIKNRKEHVEFMEKIKPHQLAALSPFARFYVVDSKKIKKSDFKDYAIPISFGKSFDTDFFLQNKNSSSRGEAAGIVSISANRVYNITGDYDPITLNVKFFFSSYEVLVNKLAVEKEFLFGVNLGGGVGAVSTAPTSFLSKVKDIRYTELLKRSTEIKLILEYGWNYSPSIASDILSPKEKELIDKFEKVYYKISPIKHTINFNEDGSFILDVVYVPAPLRDQEIRPTLKDTIFDLIISDNKIEDLSEIKKLRKKITKVNKDIERVKALLKKQPNSPGLQGRLKGYEKIRNRFLSQLKAAQKNKIPNIANYLIEEYKKNNFFNSYILSTEVIGEKITNNLTIKMGKKEDVKIVLEESATTEQIKESVKKLLEKRFEGLPPSIKPEIEQTNNLVDAIIKQIPNKQKNGVKTETSFIFFKDILRGLYLLSEQSNPNNQILFESPFYILGNVAYPLPSGDKYWCNVGDLAFTEASFRQAMIDFFKLYPNGNFKKFVNFFVQKIIPTVVVNKTNIAAFPSLATPFYHFNASKFQKDITLSIEKFTKLLQGDYKTFDNFCAEYFDSSSPKSSTGCFFIGQSSNVLYENSNIFLSKRINAFKESFFKQDAKLLELGIGKLIIGSPNGLLKRLSFSSNSDETITNLSHVLNEKKPTVAGDIISSNFQYTISAEMFGNRVYEFSNLIYVPSYTLGKNVSSPANLNDLTRQQLQNKLKEVGRARDFEIGGLYTIRSVTDNIQLVNGTYTKTFSAATVIRESQLVQARMRELLKEGNKILFPSNSFNESLSSYIDNNYSYLVVKTAKTPKKENKQ